MGSVFCLLPLHKLKPVSRELVTDLPWSWAVPTTWWMDIKSTTFTLLEAYTSSKSIWGSAQEHLNRQWAGCVMSSDTTASPLSESSAQPEQLTFLTTSALPSLSPLAVPSKDVTLMTLWSFTFFLFPCQLPGELHSFTELQWHSQPSVRPHGHERKGCPRWRDSRWQGKNSQHIWNHHSYMIFWQLHMCSPHHASPMVLHSTGSSMHREWVDNWNFCRWLTNLK